MRSAPCLITCLLLTLGACSGESTEDPADGTGGSATGGIPSWVAFGENFGGGGSGAILMVGMT